MCFQINLTVTLHINPLVPHKSRSKPHIRRLLLIYRRYTKAMHSVTRYVHRVQSIVTLRGSDLRSPDLDAARFRRMRIQMTRTAHALCTDPIRVITPGILCSDSRIYWMILDFVVIRPNLRLFYSSLSVPLLSKGLP